MTSFSFSPIESIVGVTMSLTAKNRTLILSQYPVVDISRNEIRRRIDENVDFLVVSTIASNGSINLLQKLHGLKYKNVYILVADETAVPLVSILKVLSAFIPASHRYLLYAGGAIVRFSRVSSVASIFPLVHALLLGIFTAAYMKSRAFWLLRVSRIRPLHKIPQSDKNLIYVKTNLWLGVQAGGAMSHSLGVIRALIRRGLKVLFVSASNLDVKHVEGVSFAQVIPRHSYTVPREVNHFLYHRVFLKNLQGRKERLHGILYHRISMGNFCGVELSRRERLPLIIEYNGSEKWMSHNWGTPLLFDKTVDAVEAVSLHHAHLVVTVSEALREDLIEKGIEDHRIVVHPNGVEVDDFSIDRLDKNRISAVRDKYGIPSEAIVVTFVGTFGPWHGAEVLAESASQLLEQKTENTFDCDDLYFLFIGDGVRQPEVRLAAGDLVKRGQVILTGLVAPTEIPYFLAASDILTVPTVSNNDKSPFFGSPTKLFEYMAAGKVIIASDIGQVSEIFKDAPEFSDLHSIDGKNEKARQGEIGVRVSSGSVKELSESIAFCIKNTTWRHSAGEMARELVIDRYTWDHHVSTIFERIDQVLKMEKRTRILLNALHSKSGGGVTYLLNVLPFLTNDERLDIHLCIHRDQLSLFDKVLGTATLHIVDRDLSGLWRLLTFEQFHMPLLSLKIGADIIFSPANYGPLLARKTVILLRNALSVALVERRLGKLTYWAFLYLGTSLSLFRASRAIAVSNYAKYSAAGGVLSMINAPVEIIPHGISEIFCPDDTVERTDDELLVVSDLYVQKNIHTLFKALPIVLQQYPKTKLYIVGKELDPDYASRLKEQAANLEISGHIFFVGSVLPKELPNYYRKCATFLFPSTVETFGNPLVEAMACGAPIACSNTAAMPDVAGEAAEYFNPHRPSEIADVICALLANPKRRAELSELAIKRASLYSWEETARRTSDVLITAAKS